MLLGFFTTLLVFLFNHVKCNLQENIRINYWKHFNFSRCCGNKRIYLYDINLRKNNGTLLTQRIVKSSGERGAKCYTAPYGSLNMLNYQIFDWFHELSGTRPDKIIKTLDPQDACLLILPAIPNGCYVNKKNYMNITWAGKPVPAADIKRQMVSKWLRGLPGWNNGNFDGSNHALIDFYDIGDEGPWRSAGRVLSDAGNIIWNQSFPYASFDSGNAIVIGSSLDRRSIRRGFDLPIPLIHSYNPSGLSSSPHSFHLSQGEGADYDARHRLANRTSLACFYGKVYHNCCFIRRQLVELAKMINNTKILDAPSGAPKPSGVTYAKRLTKCIFCIVVRGKGYHSFRLLEVMAAGCIPVILNDLGVLPFEDEWNWRDFSVIFSELEVNRIIPTLEELRANKRVLENMQATSAWVYDTFFQSRQVLWRYMVSTISTRIDEQILRTNICGK